jgi:membrane-associated phospholipid phosphatase
LTAAFGLDLRARWRVARPLRAPLTLGTWLVLPMRSPTKRVLNQPSLLTSAFARAAVAVALVLATMVLIDGWAVNAARGLPAWLAHGFDFLTDFGKSEWFLIPLGSVLICLALAASIAPSRLNYLALTSVALRVWFLFVAVALSGLLTDMLKLVGRGRPFVTGTANPFAYSFFDWRYEYTSLPSGHATTACAAAAAFGALWPSTRPVMWAYAALIAASRVVVIAHHPSDVMAGAFVGIGATILVRRWFAARRLVFLVDAEGKVRPRPGPSLRRLGILARRMVGRPERAPLALR